MVARDVHIVRRSGSGGCHLTTRGRGKRLSSFWAESCKHECNPDAYFCYYGDKPADGLETTVKYHHMPLGSAYEVNTSQLHSAINYGKTSRYHMVGVRYAKVDK